MDTFDIIVIGMGPGGEHVAGTLAERGLRVLGVDHGLVGGECPYWGCIPSKMMVRAGEVLAESGRVDGLAGAVGDVRPDWSIVSRRIRDEATDDWDDRAAVERFTKKGGTFVRGTGRIVGAGRVDVDGKPYAAELGIVVNAGSRAAIPPIEGLDAVPYWTNRGLVETKELPASLVEHLLGSIAAEAKLTLHARVLAGENDHHRAEAMCKAVGRALSAATRIEPRLKGGSPSTKGTIG